MTELYHTPGSLKPARSTTIPEELTHCDQWVAWQYGKKRSSGKPAKDPIDPKTGYPGDATNPEMWRGYEHTLAFSVKHNFAGVGFAISEDDPYTGIDFDDCGDRSTEYVHPAVVGILEQLGSPYAEWSPSGKGIKAFVKATKPGDRCKQNVTLWGGRFEMYDKGHYFTVTSDVFQHGNIPEAQGAVEDLYGRHFPEITSMAPTTAAPLPDPIDLTNSELLDKARNAQYGPEFIALFDHGDTSTFGGDESRADYAQMRQLRFWTQAAPDRMERLFSESALGQRDKWKRRSGYRRDTINKALKAGGKVYEPKQHRPNKTRVRDELLRLALYAHFVHPWGEKTGDARSAASDYFGFLAMLRRAWRANTTEIDFSERDYKDDAGIGNLQTAAGSQARLQDSHRLVEKVRDGNHGNAARYRIKKVSIPDHIEIGDVSIQLNPPCVDTTCDPLLSPEGFGAWLIRHPSPTTEKTHDKHGRPIPQATGDPIRGVGKPAAMSLNIAHAAVQFTGKPVPARFLASRLGSKTKNFNPRQGKDLVAAGLLEQTGDSKGYIVPEDVGVTLERELWDSGALRRHAEGRDRTAKDRRHQKIKRLWYLGMNAERIAFTTGYALDEIAVVVTPPHSAPSQAEMDAARLAKSADGNPLELDRVPDPDPELVEALREYLNLNPSAAQAASVWLANTLWCEDHVEGKPTAADVEVALDALRDGSKAA